MSVPYPGNPSLSADIKEKVLNTFRQSVILLKQGRSDEAVAGCQFVIQLDAAFQPARKLLEKARNPSAPIDVDSLLASVGPAGSDSLGAARAAIKARDFDRAVELSQAVLATDMTNAEAQKISADAQAKLEAQPFIAQFIEKAKKQRAGGNETAAKQLIEKARALDPSHPELVAMDRKPEAPMSFDFGAADSSPFGSAFSTPEAAAQQPPPFDLSTFTPTETPPPPPPPPASSDSFVIGSPDPTPPAAEASAFGFTFEEDANPPVAGSQPAPMMVPGSPNTFDFGTASVEVSSDDQGKIASFLREGDQAFDSGEFQKAIDLWSRIFLIDVTHEEASARIEKARARRVATDQQVEELVEAGTQAFERGDRGTAKTKFVEALTLDPTNFIASEYLDRLNTGAVTPEPASIPLKKTTAARPDDLFDEEFTSQPVPGGADVLMPPAPGARSRPATTVRAPKQSRSMMPLILIVLAVAVLGVGGWFGLKMLGGGDGNGAAPADNATFEQAQSLASTGQFDQAISLLSAIKPSDPEYDRALALIADLQRKKAQAATQITSQPSQSFSELVEKGQAAFNANDYVAAKQALEQAAAMQPLPANLRSQLDTASQQVARLQSASVMFKEGNYRDALTSLQALQLQDPRNQNVRQMILDAHFNLGQQALQEEKTQDAIAHFDEVLAGNPSDELARRSRDLAARYNNERKDLLYRIFVKHLAQRGV